MKKSPPMLTVLMPVYNAGVHLAEAIDSILGQTFQDFEFLIINDGSTDGSPEVIRRYSDPRLRFHENEGNLGLVSTLNRGLAMARGKYIARMDQDDISLPERLEKQVAFMDANPGVGVCGSWLETFGILAKCYWCPPVEDAQIRCEHIFHSDIYHPTVIYRKDFFAKNKLYYDKNMEHAEDYDLWVRASRITHLANIPEVLLLYRIHQDNIGTIFKDEQYSCSQSIRIRQIIELGVEPTLEEAKVHAQISLSKFEKSKNFVQRSEQWLIKLIRANQRRGLFPEPSFSEVLGRKWFEVCEASSDLGLWVLRTFAESPLKSQIRLPWKKQIKFLIKCGLKRSARSNPPNLHP